MFFPFSPSTEVRHINQLSILKMDTIHKTRRLYETKSTDFEIIINLSEFHGCQLPQREFKMKLVMTNPTEI